MFILIASYIFYGWWSAPFVLLLAGVSLWSQTMVLVIDRTKTERARKIALAVAVAGDLGALAYFKYTDFFLSSGLDALAHVGVAYNSPLPEITLPVGISFFTFQALTYVVDTYRRRMRPVGWLDACVYISYFPHLVAGPIVRASEFMPQIARRLDPRRIPVGHAYILILGGVFKKVVLSDLLSSRIVDPVFAAPKLHSAPESILADVRLRRPDLLRLQRVHRHRDRHCVAARHPLPAELRRARTPPPRLQRLLAALAHDAVAVAPRLPVHPAGR